MQVREKRVAAMPRHTRPSSEVTPSIGRKALSYLGALWPILVSILLIILAANGVFHMAFYPFASDIRSGVYAAALEADPAGKLGYLPEIIEDAEIEDDIASERDRIMDSVRDVLPPHLGEMLAREGWTVTFTSGSVSNPVFDGVFTIATGEEVEVGALTNTFAKHIDVQAKTSEMTSSIAFKTLHEIGHAVDSELGWASYSEGFADVVATIPEGCGADLRVNAQPNTHERFASAFAYCLLHPDKAREDAPEMLSWVEHITGKLSLEA